MLKLDDELQDENSILSEQVGVWLQGGLSAVDL